MHPSEPRLRGDGGALTLLIIGFAFIAALMVVLTTSVSSVYLARRELVSAVDSAAVAAAQQVDAAELYTGGPQDRLPLRLAGVRRVVDFIASQHPGVSFGPATVSGSSVTVRAERVVDLRFAAVLGVDRWTVRAEATARAPLR